MSRNGMKEGGSGEEAALRKASHPQGHMALGTFGRGVLKAALSMQPWTERIAPY
jgi:hypothetical protein